MFYNSNWLYVDWLKVGYVSNRETKFTVAGLAEGASYFFRVFAENRSGLSRPLQSDCVTPTQPLGTFLSDLILFQKQFNIVLGITSHYYRESEALWWRQPVWLINQTMRVFV